MYGLTDDVMAGAKMWTDPRALVSNASGIPSLPLGQIAGVALPLAAVWFFFFRSRSRGRR